MSDGKSTRLFRLVDELSEAARRMGVEVRREKILREVGYRARGGVCRLRGRDLEALYLSPAARRLVDPVAEPG